MCYDNNDPCDDFLWRHGNTSEIESAIMAGADMKALRSYGTRLMCAVQENPDPAVIAPMVRAGADVNARDQYGNTPLMRAANANRNPAVITALVNAGAVVNATNNHGETALMMAAHMNPNPAVIAALLDAGADATVKDSHGNSVLDAARVNRHSQAERTDLLRRAGAV